MPLLPELDTRTVLHVVEENFQRLGLKTYAIRMIYIGEHGCEKQDFIKQMRQVIRDVDSSYCEIPVHGLLLVYDSYFVHIIEGSEDTVHRQMRFLLKREVDWIEEMRRMDEEAEAAFIADLMAKAEEDGITFVMPERPPIPVRKMLKKMSVIMIYHSVSTLFFEDWRALTARPPSLVGKLDVYGPLSDHVEQLRICLDKIRKLCDLAQADENLSFEGLSPVDHKMEALPEVALLEFLLQSKYISDFDYVLHLHRRVDDYAFYFENVWPLPSHFTPRHLYKLKIDDSFVEPLPVMPWEIVKKEVEEDEEREQSESSDEY